MSEIKIERIPYCGWPNCYRIANTEVELIVTTDVGPRIIRYAFTGGKNVFAEFEDQLGSSGEAWWVMRGGHRLWVAPEVMPDTYALDNAPVEASVNGQAITLLQPVEPETFLQKEIAIQLKSDGAVQVTHRIFNSGSKPRKVAAWALSQMAPGGVGIAIFPPRGCHDECLQPTHPLVMWAYTDFSDPRWQLTKKYLILRQNQADESPQKAGLFHENTAAGYLLDGNLFVKRYKAAPSVAYPDFHSSFQIFTNGKFLELETLGPLSDLAPGESVTHTEDWSLQRNVHLASFTDDELDRAVLPYFGQPDRIEQNRK
jgi:hypothetical protein